MSRFYAEIAGQAGTASRCGSLRSGIWSHTRGWDVGVAVSGNAYGTQNDGEPTDEFEARLTQGSNGGSTRLLATVVRDRAAGGWLVELVRPDGTRETLNYPA